MFQQNAHRSGKTVVIYMGAINNAMQGKSVFLSTNNVSKALDVLCDLLRETPLNYYATRNEIVLEDAGFIEIQDSQNQETKNV